MKTGRGHWLAELTRKAGLDGEGLSMAPELPVSEAWERVVEVCGISDERLASLVAAQFRVDVADLESASPGAIKLVPASLAQEFQVFPLRADDRELTIATADPVNVRAEQHISFASGRSVVTTVLAPKDLHNAIDLSYSPETAAESLLKTLGDDDLPIEVVTEDDEALEDEIPVEGEGPIVRLANLILRDAARGGASDVHIQPAVGSGVVRFRIDGVLRRQMQLPMPVFTRVISRIKVIARIDITDRLRPQDGRARLNFSGRRIDLRISTVPTKHSEKAVIRLLDPHQSKTLEEVGLEPPELARLRELLGHREGIVIVAGPTGSGKTTTLYGALRDLATEDVNIVTVEDPVEYEVPGLTQIQVEQKQGVTRTAGAAPSER